ncbi:MAG: hypothetical protein PXX73_04390 [Sideroxydans sp.]|nr:hypothetical protein [Sideroxydans sp.]
MEEVIKFIGGTAIVIATIAWLIKSLIGHLLSKDVEIFKSNLKYQSEHGNHLLMQKIALYKEVANPVIELIVKAQHNGQLSKDDLQKFDKDRLATTALLAMFAPVTVFDKYNQMIDYIYDAVELKQTWRFDIFRGKALVFLSSVRGDIGLYTDAVEYNGTR